jgi:hypothetical protein
LSGVGDRARALDLTTTDVECHHADQALAGIEHQDSRAAVDLDRLRLHSRDPGGDVEPVHERARDPGAPAQRARQRRSLASEGESAISACRAIANATGRSSSSNSSRPVMPPRIAAGSQNNRYEPMTVSG